MLILKKTLEVLHLHTTVEVGFVFMNSQGTSKKVHKKRSS